MLTRRQPSDRWAVRPAGVADARALACLCAAHAAYERISHDGEGHAERLAEALHAGRLRAWLGVLAEAPVGYASATPDFSTLAARPYLHLDCLFLLPSARGHGLGRELMAAVAAHARDMGATQLQWQTPVWNTDAIRFYDGMGATRLAKCRYTMAL